MRAQLARPDEHLLSPEAYNQLFSMHGITMIFLYASPILSGFSNYLWPLMLGSRDMAFPRLNALSYWMFLFSGIFIYSSVARRARRRTAAGSPTRRMTEGAYSPGLNMDFYALGLIFLDDLDDRRRDQLHRHAVQDARAGHVDQPDADLHVGHAHDVVRRCCSRCRR